MAGKRALTQTSLRRATAELAATDPQLGASIKRYGTPPLWARAPSYTTLIHLILEQQVSLASAQAAFDRLQAALGGSFEPAALLRLTDEELRAIGFSRQKAGYARDLAIATLDGFDLSGLATLSDDDVRATLIAQRGIGRWTADIYLTMCLLRPDVWPNLRRARHGRGALAPPPRGRRPCALARLPATSRPTRLTSATSSPTPRMSGWTPRACFRSSGTTRGRTTGS
jgi:DNA-3-methyladenine glycosylase II